MNVVPDVIVSVVQLNCIYWFLQMGQQREEHVHATSVCRITVIGFTLRNELQMGRRFTKTPSDQ